MRSSVLLFALLGSVVGACAEDDPPVVALAGVVRKQMTLTAALQPNVDDSNYRWALADEPPTSKADVAGLGPTTTFTPDVRGVYAIERFITYRLGEELTDRFVVTVPGVPPVAELAAPPDGVVGMRVGLFGSGLSTEGRHVDLSWRLSAIPTGSTATLESTTAATTGFTPDVAGDYTIELVVFDGELYNEHPATYTVHVAAP